ncbi:MAG: hypothetical protein OER93_09060, partial [Thermoleophilia bacterium]|nr:hypothetical protein [Thermoleophilia bacterium]
AVLLVVVVEAFFGTAGFQATIAAVFVLLAGRSGDLRTRMLHMGLITLLGTSIGLLAFISGTTAWQAAAVFAGVTYLGGLAAAYGKAAAGAGMFLIVWAWATLLASFRDSDPDLAALAFLLGGGVAMIVTAVRVHRG